MVDVTQEQAMVFAILLATLVLFVWGRWRYDLVALASLLAVYLAGLVPAGQVFSGFAHPAVVTVAAVLVLSRGLLNAGVVDVLARRLARVSTRPEVQVAALTGIVTVSSGFMNNVGALALLMPVAVWMSRQAGRSPAFLLMPMAFGSLLGGLTTLIGTPPNLIIAGYRAEVTGTPFGVFDFTPVGAGVALAGLALIALAGWRWVPERPGQVPAGEVFHLEDYITEMKVTEGSRAVGRQLRELTEQVERERELTVLGLVRGDLHVPSASSSERVQAGDTLIVEADLEEIRYLMDTLGLELAAGGQALRAAAAAGEIEVAEAVIATDSPMVGESAVSLRLRRNFGVNLLAVGRQGQRISGRLA
ncbi:MAG: SLC13 family permease, partial [Syntrophomonadaceae bacterium]|nr:SLC13 family permease [Syntrophomonadaceae bacterium]